MTAIASPPTPLLRRRRDAVVGGVAGGLADHLGWRPEAMRALFAALALVCGAGVLLYAFLWAFVPVASGGERVRHRAPVAWLLLGTAALMLVSAVVVRSEYLRQGVAGYRWLIPSLAAVGVIVLAAVWSATVDRADPQRGSSHDLIVRTLSTALLLALAWLSLDTVQRSGPAHFSGWLLSPGSAAQTIDPVYLVLAFAAVLGIAAVWATTWITRFRELQSARVQGIRDEQRAEMAAHLHDSVLQTLALIQNRAGASSEVGRIARAQERELRSWLYDGDAPADSDLATDLRDYATALEFDYEAAFTVVSAGTSTERASGEVAAAAREAMLNAARHARGEVSVYIEGSPGAVEVFVRDRGPGFDPASVPDDRLGVRESIVGRMRRSGGRASVQAGAGGIGTQVHIRYPAEGSRG